MSDLVHIAADELEATTASLLVAAGMDADPAGIVAKAVIAANRRGVDSHGVVLVPRYVRGVATGALNGTPSLTWPVDSDAVGLLDADNAPGHLAAHHAMLNCIERASRFGVGVVIVRHTNHFGMAANYARMASERGFVGIATTNGPPVMAPYGGTTPSLCNNPIAFSVPRNRGDVILDMALSVVARGRIRIAALADTPIPLGWALDKDGAPTTDAHEALEGQLEWIGGYKGYGLGVIIEILAGVLSGSRFGTDVSAATIANPTFAPAVSLQHGHFFIAIDISRFGEPSVFQERLEQFATMIAASGLATGTTALKLPGEPEREIEARRALDGIPVPTNVVAELAALASELLGNAADR